jgi:tellurite resistance protein TerC
MFLVWAGFILLVLMLLVLDLSVFHRRSHAVGMKEALLESSLWIGLALAFNVFVYFAYEHHWQGLGAAPSHHHPNGMRGFHAAVLFFTGYVVEESLSVDNLFVMALVFNYFAIPGKYQHRVLFWGIVGAQIMRGAMIGIGAALIDRFAWILYIFGAFLIYAAYKMLSADSATDPNKNILMRLAKRFFPITHEIHGDHFVVRVVPLEDNSRRGMRWALTPLALALIVVETTDLIFAVDSIPAVFAITTDPFLVFTSNIFAVLGLRSLYFALAQMIAKFKYLKVSLAAILALVGVKMLARDWLHEIRHVSLITLGVIAGILGAGIVASVLSARRSRPIAMELEPMEPVESQNR